MCDREAVVEEEEERDTESKTRTPHKDVGKNMTTTSMNVCPADCSVDFWGSFINRLQIGMHWRDRMMGSFESDWDKFQFRSLRLEENYIYIIISHI